jgi:gluconolactonase
MTTSAVGTAADFTSYDAAFVGVTGASPLRVRVVDTDAHEGPVYVADEDALYFTGLPRHRPGRPDPQVAVRRLALDGTRFHREPERLSVLRADANAANGMTLGLDGALLVCEQGGTERPARISRLDRGTGEATTVVDRWRGLPLNSPNDVVVRTDGSVWFTDPSYGYLQGFRPQPQVGDYVYRFDPLTRVLTAVDDSMDKPNGLAFSGDETVLYVTDSGANQRPGSYHADRPHRVVAFDVDAHRQLTHRRLLAVTSPGFPDGIKVDVEGRVYVSSPTGVQVLAPEGVLLGQIDVPGAVNFTFGGPDQDVLFITTDTAVWAAVLDTKGA